ncbi:TPA: ATP-binding protein [Candidatus Poribacteria bacterium]|jgi:serine/threonine-protein kinase RsbW|nr:ATP-binding protein [Candidatus Poribacteria bacterium]HIA68441.1 ATP-binding protein [Candidatus Poribacteria bacterium]HIB91364.1 ATP-binding protein [Candidatus Poribacteria bacterium]HIC02743.1 ATP-binding protein [Candidatus Poribacteria bacterium]HIC16502.1 ATP-binding protein [Candidatus Poribacteria bacterium]
MAEKNSQIIKLEIPSSMDFVYLLDAVITEILQQMGFDGDTTDQVNLAVIEAGTNAIKHGNREESQKRAYFDFIMYPEELVVIVQDEGEGFDARTTEDPLNPENLFNSSGRGLFLMEACMDSVDFSQNGTVVTMTKNITS